MTVTVPPMIGPMDASAAESLLELVGSAAPRMRGAERAAAVAEVEARYQDALEALDWFLEAGRPDDAFRLATALGPFWRATGRVADADRWYDGALEGPIATDALRARALYDHGYLVFWSGHYDLAEERFVAAHQLATAVGDRNVVALALAGSARVALERDPTEAVWLLREAMAVTSDLPASEGRSSADHVLGVALQMSGDLEGAREVMTERLDGARARGDEFIVFVESSNLSMVERQLGHLDRAESLSIDALRIISAANDQMGMAWVVNGLAAVTLAKGADQRAATLIGIADTLLEGAGGEWPPDERAQYDGTLATLGARLSPAALDEARRAGAAMSSADALAFALGDGPAPP